MPTEYEPWQARNYKEDRDCIDIQFLMDVTTKTKSYEEFDSLLVKATRRREASILKLNSKLRG
jgi:hypothetical protein